MIKKLFLFIFSFLTIFFLGIYQVKAAPPPMFKLVAEEAQGAGSNEFYEGRCFRVDIYIDTDGRASGGADAIILYDNTNVTIVNNDCHTPASQIYSDGAYDVYPDTGNSVSASQINLSAYENPGNSFSSSGLTLYGHFYILVNDPDPAFDLNFDYTPGSTTDTNIAELGTGNDIIASVENLSLVLPTDSDNPYFSDINPADGDIDVPVEGVISYNMNDDMAGVDISTAHVTVDQGSGPQAESISSSCITTNANRVPRCSAIVNPAGYFPYKTLITVNADFCDLGDPTQHCTNSTWSFTTEDDVDPPYVENEDPYDGEQNVPTNTNVVFHIKDYKNQAGVIPGLGVDINSVVVVVDGVTYTASGANQFTYTGSPEDYTITIDPVNDFPENYLVVVSVDGADLHSPNPNVMATHTYSFRTSDVDPPYIDNEDPSPDSVDVASDSNVSFQIHDTGSGVDLNYLTVTVAGVDYTLAGPNTFTVNALSVPNDYEIIIDPVNNFDPGQAILVRIQARDLASPANYMNDYYYVFGAEGAGCSSCPACDSCCPPSSGGGSCTSGGGGGHALELEITNVQAVQINENSVLVSWRTNLPATTRVVYGNKSVKALLPAPNYGYPESTDTNFNNSLVHSVVIRNLKAGEVYYFAPVSKEGNREIRGDEVAVAMKWKTITEIEKVEVPVPVEKECPVCVKEEIRCPAYGVLSWKEESDLGIDLNNPLDVVVTSINGIPFITNNVNLITIEKGKDVLLRGKAKANQSFVLNFDPQIAMSVVNVDENGNWEYRLKAKDLLEGEYSVEALIANNKGVMTDHLIAKFQIKNKEDNKPKVVLKEGNSNIEGGIKTMSKDEKYAIIILTLLLVVSVMINYRWFRKIYLEK